jgi:hypothetical protein
MNGAFNGGGSILAADYNGQSDFRRAVSSFSSKSLHPIETQ